MDHQFRVGGPPDLADQVRTDGQHHLTTQPPLPRHIAVVYKQPALVRPPGSPASRSTTGVYPTQDSGDPEERVWLCLDDTRIVACTTHLANTSLTVARAQCSYLLDTAIPAARARNATTPVVLGGDLNLRAGSSDLRTCLPANDRRADDGGVQEVVATPQFTVTSRRSIGMQATTDHPGLLVTLTLASAG
jgi:endonuclease/exonuclease/phosphatase family metal-dependent hydrolase